MIILLISLFGLLFAVFLGFIIPKYSGWSILVLYPILGAASFTIIPSNVIPLTFTRFSIMVTLGIVLSRYGNMAPRYLYNSKFGKMMLLFTFALLLSSTRDSYIYHTLISHIPNVFFSFFIGYVIINNEKDLNLLVKIFVWQAAFIGLFILIEYYGDFSIGKTLAATNPNFDIEQTRDKSINTIFRSGFYRVSGLDNNAVNTGYRLAFLFPLVLWNSIQKQNSIIKAIPLLLVITGLFLLQTRAAFISIIISMLFLGGILISDNKMGASFRFTYLFRMLLLLSSLTLVLLIISPTLQGVVSGFFSKTMVSSFTGYDVSIINKLNRLPVAFSYLLSNPLIGFGSPQAVYFNLMATEDIPGAFIYFLAGGVVLGSLYLYIHSYMPFLLLKLSKLNYFDRHTKLLLIYSSCAFLAGFICTFSNYAETHFWVMYILFGAIYKTYFLSIKYNKINRKYC